VLLDLFVSTDFNVHLAKSMLICKGIICCNALISYYELELSKANRTVG
jgi:hypothetical protein